MINHSLTHPLIELSIVVPVFNEEENLPLLYKQLTGTLERLGRPYELLFIDDGSRDNSFSLLKTLHEQDSRVRVIRFRRNFGQTAAFSAGFDVAQGEIIITLDADNQNDPTDIPRLLDKMSAGYDVVSGWRQQRQDPWHRRLPSRVANWLISTVTGVHLHDYGCSLKVYRREVIKEIRLYGELHRYIPAIASWMGIEVAELPVNHYPRRFGKSKYGLSRTLRVVLDLVTVRFLLSYSTRPLQIFGLLGLAAGMTGFLMGLYLSYEKLILGAKIGDRPLLLLSVLLMLTGVQLVSMGLLGELIIRTYYEAQRKPIYVVREKLG